MKEQFFAPTVERQDSKEQLVRKLEQWDKEAPKIMTVDCRIGKTPKLEGKQ